MSKKTETKICPKTDVTVRPMWQSDVGKGGGGKRKKLVSVVLRSVKRRGGTEGPGAPIYRSGEAPIRSF